MKKNTAPLFQELFLAQGVIKEQVYYALRNAIVEGCLLPGTKIPSTRALSEMMSISRNSVIAGYDRLLAAAWSLWKCDALNGPSREAAKRFGFSFEGIFRQAVVVHQRNRVTEIPPGGGDRQGAKLNDDDDLGCVALAHTILMLQKEDCVKESMGIFRPMLQRQSPQEGYSFPAGWF